MPYPKSLAELTEALATLEDRVYWLEEIVEDLSGTITFKQLPEEEGPDADSTKL